MRYLRALILTVLVAVPLSPAPAHAATVKPWPICKFQYADGKTGWSPTEVRRTIRCAVRYWPVPGGFQQADYIAWRESRYTQYATNGSCAGVYQWMDSTWANMLRAYPRVAAISTSRYNARANVLMAVRYAHTHGNWQPWGF